MVGNDVVDLLDPDSDPSTLSARFDQRVFSQTERDQIARATNPRSERWCLWAAKEAGYKVARKCDAKVIFSPVKFRVRLDDALLGTTERPGQIDHDGVLYDVRVWCDHESVHALASSALEGELHPVHGVARLHEGESEISSADGPGQVARRMARLEVARALGAQPEEIEIRREQRIPRVYRAGRPADVDLSLSHHGALIAWAFRLGRSHRRERLAS
jgi:hypothetical protein